MDGLILGLDLCDAYTQLVCDAGEKSWIMPTVICKKKEEDVWLVGEPAYASALKGDGIIVDKLVKLVKKDGTSTIAGIKYDGMQLMVRFLVQVLRLAQDDDEKNQHPRQGGYRAVYGRKSVFGDVGEGEGELAG